MLLPRDLYSSSPPPRDAKQDNPTLLVSWWCTGFAVAIILVRIAGRYVRTERLFREDKIMALSLIPLLARMGLVHLVLLWGTNNTTTEGLTARDIHYRQIGSRLVLVSRIMYAMLSVSFHISTVKEDSANFYEACGSPNSQSPSSSSASRVMFGKIRMSSVYNASVGS